MAAFLRYTCKQYVHGKKYVSFLSNLQLQFDAQLTEDEKLIQETARHLQKIRFNQSY
jgi:hypothetical protein